MSNNQKIGPPVNTVKEFLERINEIIKLETDKENKVLFRGQENEEWKVETSAYRRLKGQARQEEVSEEDELYYNLVLIQQFKHADFHSKHSSKIMQQDLGILAQLQHMGAATSLIDFTDNAMTALWFACKKSINLGSKDNNNGKVFILSTGGENKFDEIDSIEQIENSKVRLPGELDFFKGNNILNNTKLIYWKPAHLNNRITAQQSYFLISKREPPEIQEIVVAGNSKVDIIKELSTVHGIDGTMLFPDLVGFAQVNSVGSSYGKEEKRIRKKIIIRHYDEIIEKILKDPEDTKSAKIIKLTKAYNERATAKYNFNDYEGAIDDFTKTINVDPNNLAAFNNRGIIKGKLQDYQNSINDHNKAIEIDPNYAGTYQNRGSINLKLQNYKRAINDFTKVIMSEPNNAHIYYDRGIARCELKDYKGAIDDWNRAIEINPNYTTAYNNRGTAKHDLKDYKGAIDDYNKAIKIDPNYAEAYYERAFTKSKLGLDKYKLKDYLGAIDDYQDAIGNYQATLKNSKDKYLTELATEGINEAEERLKELQDKLLQNKE